MKTISRIGLVGLLMMAMAGSAHGQTTEPECTEQTLQTLADRIAAEEKVLGLIEEIEEENGRYNTSKEIRCLNIRFIIESGNRLTTLLHEFSRFNDKCGVMNDISAVASMIVYLHDRLNIEMLRLSSESDELEC